MPSIFESRIHDAIQQGQFTLHEERRKIDDAERMREREKARKDKIYQKIVLEKLSEELRPYVVSAIEWPFFEEPSQENFVTQYLTVQIPGLARFQVYLSKGSEPTFILPWISGGGEGQKPEFEYFGQRVMKTTDYQVAVARAFELYETMMQMLVSGKIAPKEPVYERVPENEPTTTQVNDELIDLVRDLVKEQLEAYKLI